MLVVSSSKRDEELCRSHFPESYQVRLSWLWLLTSVVVAIVGPYQLSLRLLPFIFNGQEEDLPKRANVASRSCSNSNSNLNKNKENQHRTPTFQSYDFPLPITPKNERALSAQFTEKSFDNQDSEPILDKNKNKENDHDVNKPSSSPFFLCSDVLTYKRSNRIDVHLDPTSLSLSKTTKYFEEEEEEEDDDDDENGNEEGDKEEDYHDKGGAGDLLEPAGQHLLMDIHDVDPHFLLDMKRLAEAIVSLVAQSQLTLVSYHCHDLPQPSMMVVSCVGVLLKSNLKLHTWPQAGILTLDLFTCESKSLLSLKPMLEDLFAIPHPASLSSSSSKPSSTQTVTTPIVRWTYKRRGYRDYFHAENATLVANEQEARLLRMNLLLGDSCGSDRYFLGSEPILATETEFQQVEIYESSLPPLNAGSKQAKEVVNKRVFLDGTLQSTLHGLEAYHEALVHPAMAMVEAVDEVRRVAIIGGGEGATLREVLKYDSVETCVMIEIDDQFVDLAKQYLPEWNDCGGLTRIMPKTVMNNNIAAETHNINTNQYVSCFDDPRTELHASNALTWFVERYGNDGNPMSGIPKEDKFDVIIMDALDPSSNIEFSDMLYMNEAFVSSLANALTDKGVMVLQVGANPAKGDLGMHNSSKAPVLARFEEILQQHGMLSMKTYSEAHGQFHGPWEFRLVHKDYETMTSFFREPAKVDLSLAKHAVLNKHGKFPFQYFDGATWAGLQYPSRVSDDFFCDTHPRRTSLCLVHEGYDPDRANIPGSALEIKPSLIPNGGQGLFFKEDFKEDSYLAIEQSSWNMQVMPDIFYMIDEEMLQSKARSLFEHFYYFLFGYGYSYEYYGGTSFHADVGPSVFINHGCNGTYVVGARTKTTELTADPDNMPDELSNRVDEVAFFDPTLDRRQFVLANVEILLENVKASDEVLGNYLEYLHTDNWSSGIADYKAQCLMQSPGAINRYEEGRAATSLS
ncbi:hypothetical protein ACA910_015381 [Epithemia clementina (nom. ined.)]